MGAWGVGFFESDTTCDMSSKYYKNLVYHPVGQCILFDYYRGLNMQSPESKKVVEALNEIDRAIEQIKKSENNDFLAQHKIKEMLDTRIGMYNNLDYHLSNCVEGKWVVPVSKPLTIKEAATLQAIAAHSVFEPEDVPFLKSKQLSLKGIKVRKGVYKKASTYDLEEAFYFMGFTVLNLETHHAPKLLSPYVFQNFLDSTSYFLQKNVLEDWAEPQKREDSLVKEISRVLDKTLIDNLENSALLSRHYDLLQATSDAQSEREIKVYEAHFMPYIQKIQNSVTDRKAFGFTSKKKL